MKLVMMKTVAAALAAGLLAACGGGRESGLRLVPPTTPDAFAPTTPNALPPTTPDVFPVYRCTEPTEGRMAVPPAAVMGGQIEGRSDGSFVLVSHRIRGVHHVVLMLGPDLPRQPVLRGHVDAVPERLLCPSDGGLYTNGVQYLNQMYSGNYVHLMLEIDPAQQLVSGVLRDYGDMRDYGDDGDVWRVSGGPIAGTLFDPDAPASTAAALGNWTLSDAAGRPGSLSVAADGSLQLKLAECSYSGRLVPVGGMNLLDMKLQAQSGCPLDTDETQGFVVVLPMTDGRQQLMLWGVDDGWGFVVQAVGSR